MFDRDRGVKCNGTGITGSGDFIRFKGLYAERRKNSTSGYSGSRYIGGCERVIDSDAAMDRVYNLHNKAGVEAYIKSLHVI